MKTTLLESIKPAHGPHHIKDSITTLVASFYIHTLKHKSSAPSTMKTDFLTIATLAFATISGVAANPASLPMGVEITERDGVTLVREVVC